MKFGPFFFLILRAFVSFIQAVINNYGDDDDKQAAKDNGFGTGDHTA